MLHKPTGKLGRGQGVLNVQPAFATMTAKHETVKWFFNKQNAKEGEREP